MVVSDLDAFFITEVVRGCRRRLEEKGASLHLLFPFQPDLSLENFLSQITQSPAEGWLVAGFNEALLCRQALRQLGLPHVWVNHFPEDAHYTVASDDRLGMNRLMEYLLRDGAFRRFFYVDNRQFDVVPVPGRLRRGAFEENLRRHPDATAVFHHREANDPWCSRLAQHLAMDLRSPGTYPVVVCYNDYTAVDLMTALRRLGLEAPRDFGLTGFADWPSTQHIRPALTTVRQFPERMGLEAVDLLMKLLERKSVPAVERHIQTDVLLVTRDSVRMPQKGF